MRGFNLITLFQVNIRQNEVIRSQAFDNNISIKVKKLTLQKI